jgi:hypothetical protein
MANVLMDTFNFKPSLQILRRVGYGLLILVMVDVADIWIPPQFMNPSWEMQAIGSMVDKVPLLWISLALIFLGEHYEYRKSEKRLLKFLSWLTLFLGIMYFLFVPISVFNLVRIDRQNNQRIKTEMSQRAPVIQQIKQQVNQVQTGEQLTKAISFLNGAGVYPKLQNGQNIQEVKAEISKAIAQSEGQLNTQAKATMDSQRLGLSKKAIKWVLGALVSGFLLIGVWRTTRWIRHMPLED